MKNYDFWAIEKKWQDIWEKTTYANTKDDSKKEKYYVLDMFPYPSWAWLHMWHMENYTATDIYSRFMRMKGYNVLHPMGWDAFWLPAENYAIKTWIHPQYQTPENIAVFTRQIKSLGFAYDWTKEIDTSSPEYYRWTQWFFLFLYKNGLAYKKKAKVNWCNSCQTVLANEQAEWGICERCKNEVIQKNLEQWFFRITDFAEELIDDLSLIDWPSSTIAAQKNWIWKSIWVEFDMDVNDSEEKIKVYTTRVDTVYGMTYVVISPESPLVEKLKPIIKNWEKVEKYIKETWKKTELERTQLNKDKTGELLDWVIAVNPFNNQEIKVFIWDYVLSNYGTWAVMAVPAHDERDYEFAKKYDLEIIESISGWDISKEAYTEDWILVNSASYDWLTSEDAREKMWKYVEEKWIWTRKINYKLRDWLISRQRYWGSPIPIIYCDDCWEVPVPESDLPVVLPTDVDFKPTWESPLVNSKSFHEVVCPKCGKKARRESDTMDTFVCSSWYYLRYPDPKNDKEFASKESLEKWQPVDMYMGWAEHTVLHLLYARFFTKALNKFGYVNFREPFVKLRHQWTVLAEDGRKMSKSLWNVVNPDSVVPLFWADATRLYVMFMWALEDMKPWNSQNIIWVKRFLDKVWNMQAKVSDNAPITDELDILMNKTIKKVWDDTAVFAVNTAISQLMIYANSLDKEKSVNRKHYEALLVLLSPYAPHITEELWETLWRKESIHYQTWPKYDTAKLVDKNVTIAIQINWKVRDEIGVEFDSPEEIIKEKAFASEAVKKYINGLEIKKVVYVKNKLLSIVVSA
ncbi:MAG: hypothetical protein ACD_2C00193G0004 [uncultured bacterium (gcode 4)]|uniref:Leucine--tRNA ligase n=1 Tax=uncultured bacterium (gcode 4) TaxID=1234023 RepID=K2G245_9BACT|nr:MAG: hypothetical protein ACD_2C00193G0004 [uncultured bacterium (gcode 4)]